MARSLASALSTEIVKAVTAPFYLIEIGWSPTSRLSTGTTVAYDGNTYWGGSASLEGLQTLGGGGLQAEVSISNTDDVIGAAVLNADLSQCVAKIWALYGAGPWVAGDAEQLFIGVVDGASLTPWRVTLSLISDGRRRMTGPRVYCQPPICNHMPPPGTRLTWGGQSYVLNPDGARMTPYGGTSSIVAKTRSLYSIQRAAELAAQRAAREATIKTKSALMSSSSRKEKNR